MQLNLTSAKAENTKEIALLKLLDSVSSNNDEKVGSDFSNKTLRHFEAETVCQRLVARFN